MHKTPPSLSKPKMMLQNLPLWFRVDIHFVTIYLKDPVQAVRASNAVKFKSSRGSPHLDIILTLQYFQTRLLFVVVN